MPENPTDRGDWQATVQRVAQSGTQLKLISMHTHGELRYYMLCGVPKQEQQQQQQQQQKFQLPLVIKILILLKYTFGIYPFINGGIMLLKSSFSVCRPPR